MSSWQPVVDRKGTCVERVTAWKPWEAEHHCQLARLFGGLSMSDRSEMQLVADCHGVTEVNLVTALGCYSIQYDNLQRITGTSREST